MLDGKGADGLDHLLSDQAGADLGGIGQQHREFFTAIADRQIGRALERLSKSVGHTAQAVVAGRVPVLIVEPFEVVHIEHDQARG